MREGAQTVIKGLRADLGPADSPAAGYSPQACPAQSHRWSILVGLALAALQSERFPVQ